MKSVNILGVHGKIRVLEGVFTKNQYMGSVGLPKKGGLGKFANLREGLGKKEGSGVFEGGGGGGWYPNAHYGGALYCQKS